MTDLNSPTLPKDFEQAAASTPPRRVVTMEIDADVLEYLEKEGMNLREQVNGLLRFFMDTSQNKEREADPHAWEPGEMESPPAELSYE